MVQTPIYRDDGRRAFNHHTEKRRREKKKGSMSDQGIFPLYIKGGKRKKGSVSLMIYIRACAQTSRARHHTTKKTSKKGNAHRR